MFDVHQAKHGMRICLLMLPKFSFVIDKERFVSVTHKCKPVTLAARHGVSLAHTVVVLLQAGSSCPIQQI